MIVSRPSVRRLGDDEDKKKKKKKGLTEKDLDFEQMFDDDNDED